MAASMARRPASSLTFASGQDVITLDILPLATGTLTNGCEDVILTLRADASYAFGSTPEARVVICERPQTLAAWHTSKLPGSAPPDESFYEGDTDGDGFGGLMEFALNLNPAAPDSGGKTLTKLILGESGLPGLEYRRWPGAPEIRYDLQQSPDLQNWQSLSATDTIESSAALESDGLERVQHFLKAKPADGKVYLRLKVRRQ